MQQQRRSGTGSEVEIPDDFLSFCFLLILFLPCGGFLATRTPRPKTATYTHHITVSHHKSNMDKRRTADHPGEVPAKLFGACALVSLLVFLYYLDTGILSSFGLGSLWQHYGQPFEKRENSVLDLTVIRVLIGIGVFAFFNVVVITVHHIVQKVSRSQNLYRKIEHVISPF